MNRTLASLALMLLAASCATTHAASSGGRAPSPCDYFPLAVGNRWIYDGPAGPDGKPEAIRIAITGTQNGFFLQDAGGPKPQLMACDSQGLKDERRLLLAAPVERGQKWTSVVSVGSAEQYEIVDVGSGVDTPAGHFDHTVTTRATLRINANQSLINEITYAPGVGMVRIATVIEKGEQTIPQIELKLRSFERGPATP